MKNIITLTLLLISQISISQKLECNNFIFENGVVKWQKVYNSELNQQDIIQLFNKSGFIREFNYSNNTITGLINKTEIDYTGYGKSEISTESYISDSYFSCFILIELKQNRYRITLSDLKLIQRYEVGSIKMGRISELKDFAIKTNYSDFRNRFKNNSSKILNYTYDRLFRLKDDNSDNW